jgi:hypothetical protein
MRKGSGVIVYLTLLLAIQARLTTYKNFKFCMGSDEIMFTMQAKQNTGMYLLSIHRLE